MTTRAAGVCTGHVKAGFATGVQVNGMGPWTRPTGTDSLQGMDADLAARWSYFAEWNPDGPAAEVALHTGTARLWWVSGTGPVEFLRDLGCEGDIELRTLTALQDELHSALMSDATSYQDEPGAALADRIDDDWLIVADFSWNRSLPSMHGGRADLLVPKGTVVVYSFMDTIPSDLMIARDGTLLAHLRELDMLPYDDSNPSPPWIDGEEPAIVESLVTALRALTPDDRLEVPAAVLGWIERFTGTSLPAGWLDARHPSASELPIAA